MEHFAALHRRLAGDAPLGWLENLVRVALIPLGWFYGIISSCRVALYRRGLLSSYRSGIPVISVGNITVGGTGKTPTVDFLLKLILNKGLRVAVVSRGYGVRIKGVRVVCNSEGPLLSPADCGDEPYLLARRNPRALVLVAPRRRDGVKIAEEDLGAEVIILDDGFQHLAVRRDLDIVLLDARRPLGNGCPLPAGILREFPSALRRGDLFLLTRCPEPLGADPILPGTLLHSRHALSQTVFSLEGSEVPLTVLHGKRGGAFAGLADPNSFFVALADIGLEIVEQIPFSDHVVYGRDEIRRLINVSVEVDYLITTEKDGVKLQAGDFPVPCYQIPMTLQVLEEGALERAVSRVICQGECHGHC